MACESDGRCAICLGAILSPAALGGCAHVFCLGCIQAWSDRCSACPLCQAEMICINNGPVAKRVIEADPGDILDALSDQEHHGAFDSDSDSDSDSDDGDGDGRVRSGRVFVNRTRGGHAQVSLSERAGLRREWEARRARRAGGEEERDEPIVRDETPTVLDELEAMIRRRRRERRDRQATKSAKGNQRNQRNQQQQQQVEEKETEREARSRIDPVLAWALEESRRTAEEEANKRKRNREKETSDVSARRALDIAREQRWKRKKEKKR